MKKQAVIAGLLLCVSAGLMMARADGPTASAPAAGAAASAPAAAAPNVNEKGEVVLDFQRAEVGKPVATWTEQGVVFALAGTPRQSRAAGRIMFFPHLNTEKKGILNAMANEQAIPVEMQFPMGATSVTLVMWGSTASAAVVEALDKEGKVVDKASVAAVPVRKSPADAVPSFELTVKGEGIARVRFSGAKNGDFLAAEEIRFVPAGK